MEKNFRTFALYTLFLFCAFILSSCSDGSGNGEASDDLDAADPENSASDDMTGLDEDDISTQDSETTGKYSGLWSGLLVQDSFIPFRTTKFNYELELADSGGGTYTGTSRITTVDENPYYGVFDVQAIVSGTELEITETNLREGFPEPGTFWCIKLASLSQESSRLEGSWEASRCIGGSIYLSRNDAGGRWFQRLPDCPCTADGVMDGQRSVDKSGNLGKWIVENSQASLDLHPGAHSAIRWLPDEDGSGQQCTYNEGGLLITDGLGAGTPDFLAIYSGINFFEVVDRLYYHYMEDVLTFGGDPLLVSRPLIDLIVGEEDFGVFSCRMYYDLYPPNKGVGCPNTTVQPIGPGTEVTDETCPEIIEARGL